MTSVNGNDDSGSIPSYGLNTTTTVLLGKWLWH